MISPGILCTLMTCHGNWASSIALMDKAILPRPPLMVTARFAAEFNSSEMAPPDTALFLSRCARLRAQRRVLLALRCAATSARASAAWC